MVLFESLGKVSYSHSIAEWLTWSPGGVCGQHRRQLSSSRLLGAARLATVRFRRQHLVSNDGYMSPWGIQSIPKAS